MRYGPAIQPPNETVTEGLDGLRDRLRECHGMGARFAKQRAGIQLTDALPSSSCVNANACALALRFPIVEPEVLGDGSHTISPSRGVPRRLSARLPSGECREAYGRDGWGIARAVMIHRRDWRDD